MLSYVLSFLLLVASVFGNVRIVPVKSVEDIDLVQGKDVLVRSFMRGYEDVPLVDLSPEFKSIGDVRRFYENYFDSELEHYKHGKLIWVQAFEGEKLLGWATFELETDGAAYMNLLAVDPGEWKKSVGKQLTFSIQDLYPNVHEIRLLIRKINEGGRKFYERIGFSDFEYSRENFVDVSLLTGLRWVEN
ncbi:MAG TPA: GNAT family N-acetyltransferase [Chlamydiales bacterium]|nr:GNAT family N-acetyltransferase [Chlamydiales bacterium]